MPEIPKPPTTSDYGLNLWMHEVRRLLASEGVREFLDGWVADDFQTVTLGELPINSYILAVHIHCTEAFNSDGSDEIRIGWDSDTDALATLTNVSTTGVKSVTLGTNNGFNGSAQTVKAYYVNGGSEPTTGKAVLLVEFARVKPQIE